jgi:hypothetical protein
MKNYRTTSADIEDLECNTKIYAKFAKKVFDKYPDASLTAYQEWVESKEGYIDFEANSFVFTDDNFEFYTDFPKDRPELFQFTKNPKDLVHYIGAFDKFGKNEIALRPLLIALLAPKNKGYSIKLGQYTVDTWNRIPENEVKHELFDFMLLKKSKAKEIVYPTDNVDLAKYIDECCKLSPIFRDIPKTTI